MTTMMMMINITAHWPSLTAILCRMQRAWQMHDTHDGNWLSRSVKHLPVLAALVGLPDDKHSATTEHITP